MSVFLAIAAVAFICYLLWALKHGVLHMSVGGSDQGFSHRPRYFQIKREEKPELFWAVWAGALLSTVVVLLLALSGAMG
jgi:hypothetical protein